MYVNKYTCRKDTVEAADFAQFSANIAQLAAVVRRVFVEVVTLARRAVDPRHPLLCRLHVPARKQHQVH